MSTITLNEFVPLCERYSLRGSKRDVLRFIVERVGGNMCARVSVAAMARFTGFAQRTVHYALRALERLGVIVKEHVHGEVSIFHVPVLVNPPALSVSTAENCTPAIAPLQKLHPIRLDEDTCTTNTLQSKLVNVLKNLISECARTLRADPAPVPQPIPEPLPPEPQPAPVITDQSYSQAECAQIEGMLDTLTVFPALRDTPRPRHFAKDLLRRAHLYGRNASEACAILSQARANALRNPKSYVRKWDWCFTILYRNWGPHSATAAATQPTQTPAQEQGVHAQPPQQQAPLPPAPDDSSPREEWMSYVKQVSTLRGDLEASNVWHGYQTRLKMKDFVSTDDSDAKLSELMASAAQRRAV
jgi:hypothetical protein